MNAPAPPLTTRIRRRLGWGRTRPMLLAAVERIDKHAVTLRRLDGRSRQLSSSDDRLADRVKKLEARVQEAEWSLRVRDNHRLRSQQQLGAIEERLARLEDRLRGGAFVAEGDEAAEARSLIDEVRQEHARARVRLQSAASYEERLRRVEESVAELEDGDHRHLV